MRSAGAVSDESACAGERGEGVGGGRGGGVGRGEGGIECEDPARRGVDHPEQASKQAQYIFRGVENTEEHKTSLPRRDGPLRGS